MCIRDRAVAGLEPVTLQASLNGARLRRRRSSGQKSQPPRRRAFYLRTLANAVRCRRLEVRFDLGVAQDAAATAIGYGDVYKRQERTEEGPWIQ